MIKSISSIQNPTVKQLVKLQEKARERKKTGLFVIEGLREISLALLGKYEIEQLFFVSDVISIEQLQEIVNANVEFIEISKEVYQKLAYRDSTEGVIALAKIKKHQLDDLIFKKENPLILVAESPEKPGNMGALLRTADAADVDAVLIANPVTDLYNPNSIRSSVGCVFTNQIGIGTTEEIIRFLKDRNIAIFSAVLTDNSDNYLNQDFTKATALVVGTEATGLSDLWLQNATKNIIIPMQGKIDSMNVSVAAGILIFEAVRQRVS
jgi:TrmH family RNA methyltransferase